MYILAECGLIHKYLLKKEDVHKIEEDTFLTVTIEKDLSDYKISEVDNKLLFSNGAETLIFKKVSGNISDNNKFIYFLDEYNFEKTVLPESEEGIKVELLNDIAKIEKQIRALKSIIPKDNPKDKKVHVQALKELQQHKKKLLNK